MEGFGWQIGVLVVVFFLVIILGLEIQIEMLRRQLCAIREEREAGR